MDVFRDLEEMSPLLLQLLEKNTLVFFEIYELC